MSSPDIFSAASSSSSSAAPGHAPPQIRAELVNAARQFLANPRVRQTPLDEQKQFLRGKGLAEAEIEAALASSNPGGQQLANQQSAVVLPPNPASSGADRSHSLIELAKTALVVGSAGFALYRFVRSWLLPQILGVPDPAEERLQWLEDQVARVSESSRAVAEGLAQTLGTVTEQNEQINRTLLLLQSQQPGGGRTIEQQERVLAELGILKSLLLSHSQFPPIPALQNGGQPTTSRVKIPAWQLATENGSQLNGGNEAEEDGEAKDEVKIGELDRSSDSAV